MVIHNLNFVRMAVLPPKTNAPLVVNADAVLSQPTALQSFQAVAGRHGHLAQFRSSVQSEQFASCAPLDRGRESAGQFRPEQPFGLCAREAQNHQGIVTPRVNSVKPALYLKREAPILTGFGTLNSSGRLCRPKPSLRQVNPRRWLGLVLALLAPAGASPPPRLRSREVSSSLRLVSRSLSPDTPGCYNAVYLQPTGTCLRSGDRVSTNNGRTWMSEPMRPDFAAGLPHGYRRVPTTWALDPVAGRLLTIVNAMDTPGLDPSVGEPPIAQETYYLRYRVSADGGKSWLFDEPVVQAGDYEARHPFEGIWIGKNSIYIGDLGSVALVTRGRRILVPAQTTPLGPDGKLWNPTGGLTYTDVLVLIGTWTNGQRLAWHASQRVVGDPKRSTRGMIEPTLAEFPDGRLLMVMRGSNAGKSSPGFELPSYKWFSISQDGGETWSAPAPWTFEDGEPFFSPSSMSTLMRHSSGRCFWAGNLSAHNCQGNLPRWPLVVGEVDPRSLKLVRSSVLTVDTQRPEDKNRGRLDLSHFTLLEDRETSQIILAYPRSYNAYKSNEWATVRLALNRPHAEGEKAANTDK